MEKEEVKRCVLYERDCIGCNECLFCDLDPTKICDNCGKCLEEEDKEYNSIRIEGIRGNEENEDD